MKKLCYFFLLAFSQIALAQNANKYNYTIDLVNVANDQIAVEVFPPATTLDEVNFNFAKIVPGTYAILDYGRFIADIKAFDANNNELKIEKISTNKFKISNAKAVKKITYKVNDSFDADAKDNPIFEPAGTNVEANKNYVLNLQGFLGYYENNIEIPFEVKVNHTPTFYGSTSLVDADNSAKSDLFLLPNYHQAVDNPIMYCEADTAYIKVGQSDILISVFSPGKKANAAYIAKAIDTLLQAQGKYLGGTLPVDKYSFIIYLTSNQSGLQGSLGALEHSYSSFYFLHDEKNDLIANYIKDIAAHEFFHIVTPLNIHAMQIGNFNYDNPEMSEHLWLYEGTTEYHAHSVQVRYDLITKTEFIEKIKEKMEEARTRFNDTLSFTEMSKNCLEKYKEEYGNVYAKGMLIGMCIDLELIKLSNGKYRLMDLINDLAKTYGKNKSFKDEELLDKIVSLTYPEMRTFFEKHVYNGEPLPFKRCLGYVGIDYAAKASQKGISLGQFDMGFNPQTMRLVVKDTKNLNEFGKTMNYQPGDEIVKFNGKKLVPMVMQTVFTNWRSKVKEGDKLKMEVIRKVDGKDKKVKLSSTIFASDINKYNVIAPTAKPTDEQISLRRAWLKAD